MPHKTFNDLNPFAVSLASLGRQDLLRLLATSDAPLLLSSLATAMSVTPTTLARQISYLSDEGLVTVLEGNKPKLVFGREVPTFNLTFTDDNLTTLERGLRDFIGRAHPYGLVELVFAGRDDKDERVWGPEPC